MLSLDSIEKSILELESSDTTFATCERLAWLYTVRDHLKEYEKSSPKSAISIEENGEFLTAVNGKNPDAVWEIMDQHMKEIKLLYPRTYNNILERIKAI